MNSKHPEKTVLITGGARGIGKSIAIKLAKQGFRVAVNYTNDQQEAENTVKIIVNAGGYARTFRSDIGLPQNIPELFADVEKI